MPTATRRPWYLALEATLAVLAGPAAALAANDAGAIAIDNFSFDPPVLSIPAGTGVTWINHDDIPHTVTSTNQAFGSPVLDTDDRFTYRFDQPGTYRYFCKLHPHMSGTIEVTRPSG